MDRRVGGVTAYRFARDLSNRLAAVCAASGKPMGIAEPSRPVPILDTHYVNDSGVVVNSSFVAGTMHQWALWDGCPMTSRRTQSQDITTDIWGPGKSGSIVESITINPTSWGEAPGLGHMFSPGFPNMESVVWQFLSQFTLTPSSFLNGDDVPPDRPALSAPSTAANTIALSVSGVRDNVRVARLELLVDGVVEETIPNPPAALTFTWNSWRAANGAHPVEVLAYDAAGNFSVSNVVTVNVANDLAADGGAPTGLSIRNVAEGETISAYRQIRCTATDDKGIMEVDLLVDDRVSQRAYTPSSGNTYRFDFNPYSAPWCEGPSASGSHTLRAVAYDAAGHTASCAVTVNLQAPPNTDNPECSIISPANGAGLSGVMRIQANATDAGGLDGVCGIPKITRVEFLIDGLVAGTSVAASPTHSFAWDTSNVSPGPHMLQVRAIDNAGEYRVRSAEAYIPDHSTGSAAVTVTVARR